MDAFDPDEAPTGQRKALPRDWQRLACVFERLASEAEREQAIALLSSFAECSTENRVLVVWLARALRPERDRAHGITR